MGEPGPTAEQRPPRGGCAKADPFAVPDNDYKDSWLDSLWINLFSSRMSAAVEAEARRVVGGLAKAREAPRLVETSAASGFPTSLEGLKGGVSEGGSIAREGDTGRYTYEDYVDLATRLQKGPPERQREVVKGVLRSIFPPWFPAFYRTLFPFSKVRVGTFVFVCCSTGCLFRLDCSMVMPWIMGGFRYLIALRFSKRSRKLTAFVPGELCPRFY